jgi:hypothetical protein
MTDEATVEEAAAQPDAQAAPEGEQPVARPLVMLDEAEDAQACAVDGTCW